MFHEDRNVAEPSWGLEPERAKPLVAEAVIFSVSGGGGCISLSPFVLLLQRYSHPIWSEFTGAVNHSSRFSGERIWLSLGRYLLLAQSGVAEVGGG